jgi:tetratricopeptide (TPR) repeat protein
MTKVYLIAIVLFLPLLAFAEDQAPKSSRTEETRELLKASKPEEALLLLSTFRPVEKELSAYHALFATALVQSKRPTEAIEHFRLAYLYATSKDEKERLLLERSETYKQMTYYSEAVIAYKNFFKSYPQSPFLQRAHFGMAESQYRLGRFREAIESYDKSGESLKAQYGKANALHSLGMYQEANDLYLALIKKDKKYLDSAPETVYNFGENLRLLGRLLDAKIYLNSIKDPAWQPQAYVGLGLIALQEKKYEIAIKTFTEVLTTSDRKLRQRTLLHLAEAHLKAGDPEEALPRLLEIRKEYPYGKEYDAALLHIARIYKNRGKSADAVGLLIELVSRRIPVVEALEELEVLVLEMKDKDRAELLRVWNLTGHWLLDSSRTASIVRVARGLRSTGKPYLDICKWLIRNGTEDGKSQGRLLLADFYADMGDGGMALQYAKRARIKKMDDEAYRIFARVYTVGNEYKQAADALLKIKEFREQDVLLLINATRSLQDRDKALSFCKALLDKPGWSSTAYVRLADLLFDLGKKQDALVYYQTAASLKLNGQGSTAQALADIEWANYRVSLLSSKAKSMDALVKIQKRKTAMGRFAGAELKGATISERVP